MKKYLIMVPMTMSFFGFLFIQNPNISEAATSPSSYSNSVLNTLKSIIQKYESLLSQINSQSIPNNTSPTTPVNSPSPQNPTGAVTLPATFRYIKINTPEDQGWIAWREIEVYGSNGKLPIAASAVGQLPHVDFDSCYPAALKNVATTTGIVNGYNVGWWYSYCSSWGPTGYNSTPDKAYDGNTDTVWNGAFTSYSPYPKRCHIIANAGAGTSGYSAYQNWITLDLGSSQTVTKMRMMVEGGVQTATCGIHQVMGSLDGTNFALIKEFSGDFFGRQWLQYPADSQNPEVGSKLPVSNASIVSVTAPDTVSPGQRFTASVVIKNTGQSTWTKDIKEPFRLGSQQPLDNQNWGLGRVELPVSSVAPGMTTTFTFNAIAPGTAGSYLFAWKMVHELVEWFGQTASKSIIVK
jgi:hypothetical protein